MKEFKRPKPNCPIHGNASIKMQNYIGKTDEGYEFDREGLKIAYCNICNEYYFNDYRYPDKLGMHKITAHSINGMINNNKKIIIDGKTLYLYSSEIPNHCKSKKHQMNDVYGVMNDENSKFKVKCKICKCCGKIFVKEREYEIKEYKLKKLNSKNLILIDDRYLVKDIKKKKGKKLSEIFSVCNDFDYKPIAAVSVRENDKFRIYGIISLGNRKDFDKDKYKKKGILLDKSVEWYHIKDALWSHYRKFEIGNIEYEVIQYRLINDKTMIDYFKYAAANETMNLTDNSSGLISIQVYQQNRCKCEKIHHNIKLVEVKIKNVFEKNVDIRCFYCQDCKKYYIQQVVLDYYFEQYCGLVCLFNGYQIRGKEYDETFDYIDLPAKSKLRLYGYNVSEKTMTSVKRHALINTIIKYNLMKPNEIITQINYNMNMHKRHKSAINKWKEDIAFIEQNYMRDGQIIVEGNVRFHN